MSTIILPPTSTPANPSEGEIYYDNTSKQVKVKDASSFKALADVNSEAEPHIITKKLHPAYLGKLLDDTTSHSGAYGTEQADGRMYYYTDIAGSKPIHDPRIGAHFGSQRYRTSSLQVLEQETATHGRNVYSVDGRDWIRVVDSGWTIGYGSYGNSIYITGTANTFLEVVGYFTDVNIHEYASTNRNRSIYVDGSIIGSVNGFSASASSVTTPLTGRYVNSGSLVNYGLNQTLGIHTLKVVPQTGHYLGSLFNIELIAQDTTSSSTKVQIQVPAQDVVSYGRKFAVSATAQHYDPFNGFSSGNATAFGAKVDTATSLGCDKWLHSSTYYRPYNGMRVIKWIDENGAIKTSVTVMPPNAKSIGDSSSLTNANAKANASVANDTFYPTFEAHTTSVNEDNLHEVAKTFHVREFGNGSANGGTGATWADVSMLDSSDDIAFCMDDGLTSFTGKTVAAVNTGITPPNSGTPTWYTTFIGTGIAIYSKDYGNLTHNIAQNLPYGSHILKGIRDVPNTDAKASYTLDGILFDNVTGDTYGTVTEIHIYQPKKPPIPDSACVLADYMVFADFKPQTVNGTQYISKGVRRQNISRDVFFDETDGDSFTFNLDPTPSEGFQLYLSGTADSDNSMKMRIPSFGTNYVHRGYQTDTRTKLFIGDVDNDSAATKNNTSDAVHGSYAYLTSDLTLGIHQFGANAVSGQNGLTTGFDIVTPIHTSSHYQSFESPFLHELIGGDRNMEQTNLICSSDGKSWDEVTRDTSYIGNSVVSINRTNNTASSNQSAWIFDECRGTFNKKLYNKDWAIAYDRMICLKDGQYQIDWSVHMSTSHLDLEINSVIAHRLHSFTGNASSSVTFTYNFQRGDILRLLGGYSHGTQGNDLVYQNFQINRI